MSTRGVGPLGVYIGEVLEESVNGDLAIVESGTLFLSEGTLDEHPLEVRLGL